MRVQVWSQQIWDLYCSLTFSLWSVPGMGSPVGLYKNIKMQNAGSLQSFHINISLNAVMYNQSAIRQYHCSGHVVYIIRTHVTLAVIRLHNASQAPIQCYMSLGICGKHEQVGSTRTPTNLLLANIKCIKKQWESWLSQLFLIASCIFELLSYPTLHTAAWMMASKPPSGASLFRDTFCIFTSSVKRLTLSVRDRTCL